LTAFDFNILQTINRAISRQSKTKRVLKNTISVQTTDGTRNRLLRDEHKKQCAEKLYIINEKNAIYWMFLEKYMVKNNIFNLHGIFLNLYSRAVMCGIMCESLVCFWP